MKAPASRSSIFQLLKQHFTGPKRVELPVSAYGKLPIYKDFLRHGLAGAEAQALKRWLDRGVSKFWAVHEEYRDEEIPTQALLLGFPATGKQILGYLWGSHDHGGLRRFPFVLFVSLPSPTTPAALPSIFALEQVVEQASRLRRRLAEIETLDAYYPLIRTSRFRLEIHGEKSLRERLGTRDEPTVGDLGDVFYGEDDPADRWPALLHHLHRVAAHPEEVFAARLPGTGALPTAELVSLWCVLLGRARRNTRKPLQVLYGPGASHAGITVLHRELRPDDVFAFHPEMPGYDAVDDLRHKVPGARETEPVEPRADSLASAIEDAEEDGSPSEDHSHEPASEDRVMEGPGPEDSPGVAHRDDEPEADTGDGSEPAGRPEEAENAAQDSPEETEETDEPAHETSEESEETKAVDDDADDADEEPEETIEEVPSSELSREQRALPWHAVLDRDFLSD